MSNTLPDPDNPQVGDRFQTEAACEPFTVLYVGKYEAFVKYDDDSETSWSLEWITGNCVPVPPPPPGPDEVWIAYDEPGDRAYWAYRTMQDADEGENPCVPIVRYVKADPQ